MKFFKVKRNFVLSDKAVGWMADGILKVQNKFAKALGKLTARWQLQQQILFLSLVCLTFGGISVLVVLKSFSIGNTLRKPVAIKTSRIIPEKNHPSLVTEHDFKRVLVFKQRLDSISKTDDGKVKVENLLKLRPGLMDSVSRLEQLYKSQK